MAGTATNIRQAKERAVADAEAAGIKGKDLDVLRTAAKAARATELSETGQSGQAGYHLDR